jgi:heterodisulfide reductase subunit C
MKTLKRLKNLLSGEENKEEEKTETLEGETEQQVTQTTIKKDNTKKPSEKTVKPKAEEITEDTKSDAGNVKSQAKEKTEDVKSKAEEKTEEVSKASKTVEKEEKPAKSKTDRSGKMTLLEGREEEVITRKNIDPDFKQEIMDAGAESVALCFQCGTCTGACPSGRRTPYRIRQVVRKAVMGLKEEVIADDTIWMCATCYECQERCPRGIKIVDIVKTVRNFAAQAGYMAPAHKATGSFVIKTGHGVPINDKTMALRKSVGLGELPPTTHQFPEALEEVQKIMKATGFDNLIGWNWEKGELE